MGLFGIVVVVLFALSHAGAFAEQPDRVLFEQRLPRVPVHLVTEVRLDGKPCLMLIDTGEEAFTLDLSKRGAKFKKFAKGEVIAFGGSKMSENVYTGPPVKAQSLSVEEPFVVFSDMRMLSKFNGWPLAGIMGIQALRAGKVFLNYDEHVLQVHSGPWKLNKPDCQEVQLIKDSNVPMANVKVMGYPATVTFDTGSDGCIDLEAKVFNSLVKDGVIELAKKDQQQLSLKDVTPAGTGWFLKGKFMGKSLVGVSVSSSPGSTSSAVGLQWLYGFNTEIDSIAHKLRYQVRRDAKFPGEAQRMLGATFSYDWDGALIEGPTVGAAKDAGLNFGDLILEFGPLKAGKMNVASIGETVADAAGKEMAIRYLRKSDGKYVDGKLKLPPAISEWDFAGRDILKPK